MVILLANNAFVAIYKTILLGLVIRCVEQFKLGLRSKIAKNGGKFEVSLEIALF